MASVHKHSSGRSPYYYASYLGLDGRWKLRSTKTSNRRLAMRIAIELEHAAKMARVGALTLTQVQKVLYEIFYRVR